MNRAALLLTLVSVLLTAGAQIVLKAGMKGAGVQAALASGSVAPAVRTIATDPLVIGGLAIYGLAAILWLLVLSRVDVSLAYPFVALGFVVTAILGRVLFGETLSVERIAGTLLICGGVLLLARS